MDWHNANCKCRKRVVRRKVIKTGTKYLTLSAVYTGGTPVQMKLSDCFSTKEGALAALEFMVAAMAATLSLREKELASVPEEEVSYACQG